MSVLGVHGVYNLQAGLDADAAAVRLAGWWRAALGRFLDPGRVADVRVHYYADLLSTRDAQGPADEDFTLPDEDSQAVAAWAAHIPASDDETPQGYVTAPLRQAVDRVARHYGLDQSLTRRFVARFFPEVSAYLGNKDARDAVVDRFIRVVDATGPTAVVAHSLGTVVAYEALWAHPEVQVPLLLTLGSPLAMPDVILPRLTLPSTGAHGRPPGVARWINLADLGDPVAVPAGGVSTGFTGVDADITTAIRMFDFHRAQSYLASPPTAAALAAVL